MYQESGYTCIKASESGNIRKTRAVGWSATVRYPLHITISHWREVLQISSEGNFSLSTESLLLIPVADVGESEFSDCFPCIDTWFIIWQQLLVGMIAMLHLIGVVLHWGSGAHPQVSLVECRVGRNVIAVKIVYSDNVYNCSDW